MVLVLPALYFVHSRGYKTAREGEGSQVSMVCARVGVCLLLNYGVW